MPKAAPAGHRAYYRDDAPMGFYGAVPPMAYTDDDALALAAPPPPPPPAVSLRASSGAAWSAAEDQTLMRARASSLNWAAIQAQYFPAKSANACRKRHERLMDRRHADNWALENLAKEYMSLRQEIWSPLATRTRQKWTTVESKCMAAGYKNLLLAARACSRRERHEAGVAGAGLPDVDHGGGGGGYDGAPAGDGSVVLDAGYGAVPLAHVRPDFMMQQRLPAIDMGIDAIINQPLVGGGGG